ncbi:hypothetical protein NQD34_010955, partial [Periophthalmus magnuspinnatus]
NPVTHVREGVIGQHEAIWVQGVSAKRGRRRVDAVDGVRGVHEWITGLEGVRCSCSCRVVCARCPS